MAILVLGLDDGEHIELPYSFGESDDDAAHLALRLFKDQIVYRKIEPDQYDAIPDADGLNLAAMEYRSVIIALRLAGWVQKDAAELLGITARSLMYKIKRYNIHPPEGMGKGWSVNR